MKNIFIAILTLCCLLPASAAVAGPSGQAARGCFRGELLPDILEKAANKMEDGLSIQKMLSRPYKIKDRVVVDFSPPGYPRGISFSLDNMLPDGSSNTLSLNIEPQDGARPNGDLLTICVYIVLFCCPPGTDDDGSLTGEIDKAISSGQSITLNGWTYSGNLDGDGPIAFSATAGPARPIQRP